MFKAQLCEVCKSFLREHGGVDSGDVVFANLDNVHASSHGIECNVSADAYEPRLACRISTIRLPKAPGPQKRLLNDVIGEPRIFRDAECISTNGVDLATNRVVEGVA